MRTGACSDHGHQQRPCSTDPRTFVPGPGKPGFPHVPEVGIGGEGGRCGLEGRRHAVPAARRAGLGSNRYENYATVIVLGRNELPVEALEDQGRSLFGDRDGQPLQFVEADESGRRQMPELLVPYEMTAGESVAVPVRFHPDARIREIQMQHRECCTRQLVERLRLARAPYRKRVILVCNIPIPGLPVDNLVRFDDLCPRIGRLGEALSEAASGHRTLILTAKELPKCASVTFESDKATETWLTRTRKILAPL